jgi:adenine phosphoribosyltransferase
VPPGSDANDLQTLLKRLLREIPDFPEPGVLFRDLTPAFADATAFRALIDALVAPAPEVDERAGATVSAVAVVLEIAALRGRERLAGRPLSSLLTV